jgi:hypothetical protein
MPGAERRGIDLAGRTAAGTETLLMHVTYIRRQ